MKLTVKEFIKPTPPLSLGDIIEENGKGYIVTKDTNRYIARSLEGLYGMTGYHDTLDDLKRSLNGLNVTIYSQLEFDFELIIKHKGDL